MANKYVQSVQPYLVIKYMKTKQQSDTNFANQINKRIFLKLENKMLAKVSYEHSYTWLTINQTSFL